MKKRICFMAMLLAFVAVSSLSAFDLAGNKQVVVVSGVGVVKVKADTASVSVAVVTEDEKASISSAKNAEIMTKVQESLLAMGVSKDDISTSGYSVYQNERYVERNKTQVIENTYRTSNDLNVLIRDLTTVGKILDACLEAGANRVSRLSFYVEDTSAAYDKARILAIEKSRKSAEVLAKAANRKIGRAIQIVEEYSGDEMMVQENRAMQDMGGMKMAAMTTTPVSAGSSEIRISVNVVYELK